MKQFITGITALLLLSSCNNHSRPIVSAAFIDSLISDYTEPAEYRSNQTDLLFWKNRIDPGNPGMVSELRYASMLVKRFQLLGDIHDLVSADSILHVADNTYRHKEPGPLMAMVRNCILQHRFAEADSLLREAKKTGLKPYDLISASFDVDLELGRYDYAGAELKNIADTKDYGYHFRYAKLAHYNSNLDSSIAAMQKAAGLAGNDLALKQAALSNEADLNLHKGDLKRAYQLYVRSVGLNNADLHSLMGIGWIALVHDDNDALAERIFSFVRTRTKSPDVLLKLISLAEKRGDSTLQRKFAHEFESIVTQPAYGNMYNKYLVGSYTGILDDPAKAETLAKKELVNRATPQTYAWYVWALYRNNKTADAEGLYYRYVSGKPLEGLELYWMGKFMQGIGKGYNAKEFFKAAYKNRYDLGCGMAKELSDVLEK